MVQNILIVQSSPVLVKELYGQADYLIICNYSLVLVSYFSSVFVWAICNWAVRWTQMSFSYSFTMLYVMNTTVKLFFLINYHLLMDGPHRNLSSVSFHLKEKTRPLSFTGSNKKSLSFVLNINLLLNSPGTNLYTMSWRVLSDLKNNTDNTVAHSSS